MRAAIHRLMADSSPTARCAPLLAMTFALYTFGGVEIVAITTGESRCAGEIPRAVRHTFAILAVVYLGAIIVLVGVMPWNRVGVTESPFVTVFRMVGIPAARRLMNFVILTAALSGANANLYAASACCFRWRGMGWAPASLGQLNAAGSPNLALLASSFGIVVALVAEIWAPKNAFRVHPERCIVWLDAVLAGFAGSSCLVPPAEPREESRRYPCDPGSACGARCWDSSLVTAFGDPAHVVGIRASTW